MIKRTDTWTTEEDTYLTNTMLEYIRNGRTQLEAFEVVGEKFNRTSAAVGFRWNSTVRHQHKEEIELAKKEKLKVIQDRRKNRKSTVNVPVAKSPAPTLEKEENLTIQEKAEVEPSDIPAEALDSNETKARTKDTISKMETILGNMLMLKADLKKSNSENERLQKENESLKAELQSINDEFSKLIEAFNQLHYSNDEKENNSQMDSAKQLLGTPNEAKA